MIWTPGQIAALQSAIASGATTVSYDGKSVTYRSLTEMRTLLAEMNASVIGAGRTRQVRMFTYSDKGL